MAGLEITFEIEGEKQLLRRLEGISKNLQNWTPQFKKIGDLLLKTFKENFISEGRTLNEPWAPLKPTTLIEKQRLGFPPNILIRTGKMKDNFKASPGKFEVVISNPTPYFPYHQSRQPRQKLPRRVMMKIDERRKQFIVKIIQKAAEDILQRRTY